MIIRQLYVSYGPVSKLSAILIQYFYRQKRQQNTYVYTRFFFISNIFTIQGRKGRLFLKDFWWKRGREIIFFLLPSLLLLKNSLAVILL